MFEIGSGWWSAIGVGCELFGFAFVACEYLQNSNVSGRNAASSAKRVPTTEGDWHPECISDAFKPIPEDRFFGPADEVKAARELRESRENGIEALVRTSYYVLRQVHLTRSVDAPKTIRDILFRRKLFVIGAFLVVFGGALQVFGSIPSSPKAVLAPAMFEVDADRPVSITVEKSGAVSLIWSHPDE